MDLPTIQQLRYLVNLYDAGSFHAAAAACFVSQSTLSTGIKNLENQLDSLLVDRSNRVLVFTDSGNEVVEIARNILQQAHDIVNLTRQHKEFLTGTLKMGIIPTAMPFLLPGMMRTLKTGYPDLSLQMTEDLTDVLLERLQQGLLDLVLIAYPYRPADRENLHREILFEEPFHLVYHPSMGTPVPPDGRSTGKGKQTAKGNETGKNGSEGQNGSGKKSSKNGKDSFNTPFPPEKLLLLAEGHCLRGQALRACSLRTVPKLNTFDVKNLFTLIRLVDEQFGYTYLPEMAIVNGILDHTNIASQPVASGRQIALVWRKSSSRDEEFRLLGNAIRESLDEAKALAIGKQNGNNGTDSHATSQSVPVGAGAS